MFLFQILISDILKVKVQKKLVVIAGPTAVGKTKLAVKISQYFNSEVISADSRQFFKEMAIGTAKPTIEEMEGVKHHFVDSYSIHDYFSVGDYEREVKKLLAVLFETHNIVVLTGGSGLYLKAVLHGIDEMPAFDENLRNELLQKLETVGLIWFQNQLKTLDVTTYQKIDIQNVQRVFRAVEVSVQTGKPYSTFLRKESQLVDYQIIKIGIERERQELYERINNRVEAMMQTGLVEEVKNLIAFKHLNSLQTVGYKEVFSFLENEITEAEMIDKIKQNSRRYAKRQLTWFKNQDDFNWFHPDSFQDIIDKIERTN